MTYYLIRLAIGLIVFGFWLLVKRLNRINVNFREVSKFFAIALLIFSLDYILTVENLFYSFPNPETAYQYEHFEKPVFTLEGKYYATVFTGNGGDIGKSYVYKRTENGWKISRFANRRTIPQHKVTYKGGNLWFSIWQVNDANDYFIWLSNNEAQELSIKDNRNSKFIEWQQTNDNITYYTAFQDIEKGYTIIIDGEEIVIIDPNIE